MEAKMARTHSIAHCLMPLCVYCCESASRSRCTVERSSIPGHIWAGHSVSQSAACTAAAADCRELTVTDISNCCEYCAVVRRLAGHTRDQLIAALSSTDCTLHPNLYKLAVRFDDELD